MRTHLAVRELWPDARIVSVWRVRVARAHIERHVEHTRLKLCSCVSLWRKRALHTHKIDKKQAIRAYVPDRA